MTDRTKKFTLRLSEEELDTIQILAEKEGYEHASDFVRTALNIHVQSLMTPQYLKSVVVNIPIGQYDRCKRIVQAGEAVSVQAEIEKAFENHMHNKSERLVIDSGRIDKIEKIALDREQRRSQTNDLDRHFRP